MWIPEVHFYAEHYRTQHRTYLTPQWPQMVADLLRGRGLIRGRVGVDTLCGPILRLPDLLPGVQVVDAARIPREMRMVKCEEELALIRQGAELSDWGRPAIVGIWLRDGRLRRWIPWSPMRWPPKRSEGFPTIRSIHVSGLTGPNSACPHGISGDYGQVVEKGHGIVNIVIPRLNGYVCENERTFFVGTPSREQAAAFEAAAEAQAAGRGSVCDGGAAAAFRPRGADQA
jgi:Xaa-Pro aminopeptidase